MFDQDFAERCLPFGASAASQCARIVSARIRMGRPISVEDAQIAAIALAHRMALATRNTTDFERIEGLILINPRMEASGMNESM
jgi:predicted nucleic acid-binding protein